MKPFTPRRTIHNRWLSAWIRRGPDSDARPVLAEQLRMMKKTDGRKVARNYRDWIVYIGSYPSQRSVYA